MPKTQNFNDLLETVKFKREPAYFNAVADPGFARPGRLPKGGGVATHYLAIFPENCMKMKEIRSEDLDPIMQCKLSTVALQGQIRSRCLPRLTLLVIIKQR